VREGREGDGMTCPRHCHRCGTEATAGRLKCPCGAYYCALGKLRSRYCPLCRKPQQSARLCEPCRETRAGVRRAKKDAGGEGRGGGWWGQMLPHPTLEARLRELEARAARGEALFSGRRAEDGDD
jgi:hypothetical protein